MGYTVRKDHGHNLPTIRITEIELKNFKSVKYGKVTFNCGKKYIPYGTESDVLGLYGQNGSGKTSIIEAINILKCLLSGQSIPKEYVDCIDVELECSELSFSFDFQYPDRNEYSTNRDIRKVVYEFKIKRGENSIKEQEEETHIFVDDDVNEMFINDSKKCIVVYDEVLKVSGTICGEKVPLKPFLDTTNSKAFLEPKSKVELLLGKLDEEKKIRLGISKAKATEGSKSYLFLPEMLEMYSEFGDYSPFYQMIVELRMYGSQYLHVVDSKSTGLVGLNVVLPIFVKDTVLPLPINKSFIVDSDFRDDLTRIFENLSLVLNQIVPGLTIFVKDYGMKSNRNGDEGRAVELFSKRGEKEIPLRSESEGVKKLIATLHYLIMVYNQQSFTVAYDEFDSGIFEYLLGEILQVIQTSGKGQFIFTSHNMRPLEVLKKEFIWFTTTDPENRYIKLSGLGETNNMRKVYYREIAMHENYDNLYSETKRNLIVSAMRKAGGH